MQKKKSGAGIVVGVKGGCDPGIEVIVKMLKKRSGGLVTLSVQDPI